MSIQIKVTRINEQCKADNGDYDEQKNEKKEGEIPKWDTILRLRFMPSSA